MKKVFLMIELTGENGEHIYAVQYTGVMTRRNIYAKLTQDTGCPYPEYVKVSKWDTIDKTEEWNSAISGRKFRHIKVLHNVSTNDSRIQKSAELFSNNIIEAIDSHIQENDKLLAAI